MMCDECKQRPASVHWTSVVNGQSTSLHLCAQCAAKHEAEAPGSLHSPLFVNDLINSFLGGMSPADVYKRQTQDDAELPLIDLKRDMVRRSDARRTHLVIFANVFKLHVSSIPVFAHGSPSFSPIVTEPVENR